MNTLRAVFLAAFAISGPVVNGAAIDLGNHVLLPNTPNQVIPIYASGTERFAGMLLELRVEGLEAQYPRIMGVDLHAPGLFFEGGWAFGAQYLDNAAWSEDIVIAGDRQLYDGAPIAHVALDTTGIAAGEIDKVFSLYPYIIDAENRKPIYHLTMFVRDGPESERIVVVDDVWQIFGTLTIQAAAARIAAPEPSSVLMMVSAMTLGLFARFRPRCRTV